MHPSGFPIGLALAGVKIDPSDVVVTVCRPLSTAGMVVVSVAPVVTASHNAADLQLVAS